MIYLLNRALNDSVVIDSLISIGIVYQTVGPPPPPKTLDTLGGNCCSSGNYMGFIFPDLSRPGILFSFFPDFLLDICT